MGMVDVILLKNVDSLGEMGKVVQVRSGYARNYLIPNRIADIATTKLVKQFEHSKRVIQAKVAKTRRVAEGVAGHLNHTELLFRRKVGQGDKLFGSVTAGDIADALVKRKIEVDKKQVVLETPIKEPGKHKVPVRIFQDIKGEVLVEVVGEAATNEETADSHKTV